MDMIEMARKLGAAIQADPAYVAYNEARIANDNDEELQKLIGEFNLQRMAISNELQKDEAEKNQDSIDKMNDALQDLYGKIMANENMAKFTELKNTLDEKLNLVNGIISMSISGEDPETCDPAAAACSGNCSSCGGCH